MNLYNKLSFAFKMLNFHGNVLRGSIFVVQLERCNLVLYMQCNHINIEHGFFHLQVYVTSSSRSLDSYRRACTR